MLDFQELMQIDALQARYMAALDDKDMKGWLATFSTHEGASYICTTAESESANLPMALIMDDNYGRLQDRVTFVDRIWEGIYAEYNSRHFVQRTSWARNENGLIDVKSNYLVVTTPSETGRASIFSSGIYLDQIDLNEGEACFRSKKVIMDTAAVERFMAYPL